MCDKKEMQELCLHVCSPLSTLLVLHLSYQGELSSLKHKSACCKAGLS